MLLLNIALGDAARQQTVVAPECGREFDAEVDELAKTMRGMSNRVEVTGDGIRVSRMEAKDAMELIRDRLLFQLRTRRAPKDTGIAGKQDEDLYLPKQVSFMETFLQKRRDKARPSVETSEIAA